MSSLSKHLVFVNEQIGIQNRLAKKYEKDERRSRIHLASRDAFIALLSDIEEADAALDAALGRQVVQTPVLTLRVEDLDGLPQELLSELSEGAVPDRVDTSILSTIDMNGGIASLDQILVGLYRNSGELWKRNTLTSKLYRMAQKGVVFQVPEKKGVYSTRRISEEDARRLFGLEGQEGTQQQLV